MSAQYLHKYNEIAAEMRDQSFIMELNCYYDWIVVVSH